MDILDNLVKALNPQLFCFLLVYLIGATVWVGPVGVAQSLALTILVPGGILLLWSLGMTLLFGTLWCFGAVWDAWDAWSPSWRT